MPEGSRAAIRVSCVGMFNLQAFALEAIAGVYQIAADVGEVSVYALRLAFRRSVRPVEAASEIDEAAPESAQCYLDGFSHCILALSRESIPYLAARPNVEYYAKISDDGRTLATLKKV